MQNVKAIKKVKMRIGAYFIDIAMGKTPPLNFQDIYKKYNIWHQVLVRNLGESYFDRKKNVHEVKVFLNEKRKEEVQDFIKKVGKHLVKYEEKDIIEMLFYAFNNIKK